MDVQLNVLIRAEQRAALTALATQLDRSMAWVVRDAIDKYVADHAATAEGLSVTYGPTKRKGRG
jgi:hypothetical protein